LEVIEINFNRLVLFGVFLLIFFLGGLVVLVLVGLRVGFLFFLLLCGFVFVLFIRLFLLILLFVGLLLFVLFLLLVLVSFLIVAGCERRGNVFAQRHGREVVSVGVNPGVVQFAVAGS